MKYLIILSMIIVFSTQISDLLGLEPVPIEPAFGDGTAGNPYQIETLDNLYWIVVNPVYWPNYFIQTADIDANQTINWFNGQGWVPIGYYISIDNFAHFTGTYDGQGHTISGLFINRPQTNNIGLFGRIEGALIQNLNVINVSITGQNSVGGLAGQNRSNSTIDNCYSTGSVAGYSHIGGLVGFNTSSSTISNCNTASHVTSITNNVGGLLGTNSSATVTDCYSDSVVEGSSFVGGLVGWNNTNALIDNCYSISSVSSDGPAGGLVGVNQYDSIIQNSHSTGDVISYGISGCGTNNSGGLLGLNQLNSSVINCYSTGNVNGIQNVGGLVGDNSNNSLISRSFSSGNVTGSSFYVGGLVGNNAISTVDNSYSTGNVSGFWRVGGLVGSSSGLSASISNSYSTGNVSGTHSPGGLVGYNSGGTVTNSYWNTQTSGQPNSHGGQGRTTSEMTYPYAANTYVGWDFTNIWTDDTEYNVNIGYPFHQWYVQDITLYPPANLSITVLGDQILISWDAVEGAYSYILYTTANPYADTPEWTVLAVVGEPIYQEPIADTMKFYRIVASTEDISTQGARSLEK